MLLVIAERCARSSTSIATCTSPPSSFDMQGGTGASYTIYHTYFQIDKYRTKDNMQN